MTRKLVEAALVDGDDVAFKAIAPDYYRWLSMQDHGEVQNRYFANCEALALDFVLWMRKNQGQNG